MGSSLPSHRLPLVIAPSTVAVFDLDYTLTRCDTYLHFLWEFLREHPWRVARAGWLPLAVAQYGIGKMSNATLKECFLSAIFGGVSRTELEMWAQAFVERMIRAHVFHEGLLVLGKHRQEGDYLVLLSASPDVYVRQLGQRLGFDEVICTMVEWQQDRLTGQLAGPNVRGEEKVKVLRSLRQRFPQSRFVAYADNRSDLAMLRLADQGFLVNGARKARRQAQSEGIHLVGWER